MTILDGGTYNLHRLKATVSWSRLGALHLLVNSPEAQELTAGMTGRAHVVAPEQDEGFPKKFRRKIKVLALGVKNCILYVCAIQ